MFGPSGEGMAPVDETAQGGLEECLVLAVSCLEALGNDYADNRAILENLSERLSAGQFRLAVLGQFKRGKSTLLNALLGDKLLPTDILPVTAIPTFISYAETLSVRVIFSGDTGSRLFSTSTGETLAGFLAKYVTEAGNPNNHRQVERVEIGHPARLLEQGVVLIDTPGIGSTHRHNTEVAYQVLPQCDAALFLVSPDPPITEAELDYLKEICQQLPRTFFLLNKVDFLDEEERVVSLKFLADQLAPLLDCTPQVLPVSARNGLRARLSKDLAAWQQSGMAQVEENLIDFFAKEKRQVLHDSIRRRAGDQLNHVGFQLRLSLQALTLSEEQLKQRIDEFRSSLPEIEREKLAAKDVLAGDLKRLAADLTEEAEETRKRAKETISTHVETLFQTVADTEELERRVRAELNDRIPRFFAAEMHRVSEVVQREGTTLLNLHRQHANRLIEKVRQNAAELFDIPYRAPAATDVYTAFPAPAWSRDLFISDMDPLGQKLSRKFLTHKFRHRRTVSRLRDSTRKLISENVEQINWTLRRGIDESFRQYSASLTEQLDKTVAAVHSAMELALSKRESRAFEVAEEELRLRKKQDEIQTIIARLDN